MGTLAAKVTSGVFICLILLGCTQKGNILYLPDPEEPRISTAPLVTVIYDPFALGDRSYNDLIYQGVEEAAAEQSWADNWNREGNFWMSNRFSCNLVREPVPQRARRIYTLP